MAGCGAAPRWRPGWRGSFAWRRCIRSQAPLNLTMPLEVLRLDSPGALCGGQRLGEQDLEPLGADALAPARHGGPVERQRMPEPRLAAEQLDIGAVEVAGADGVVGEAVHVLEHPCA